MSTSLFSRSILPLVRRSSTMTSMRWIQPTSTRTLCVPTAQASSRDMQMHRYIRWQASTHRHGDRQTQTQTQTQRWRYTQRWMSTNAEVLGRTDDEGREQRAPIPDLSLDLLDAARRAQHRCEFDSAIALYSKLISSNSHDATAYRERGVLYDMVRGQFKEAEQDFTTAIRLDPSNPDNYRSRGILFSRVGRLQESLDDFDKAAQLDPNNVNLAFDRANVLFRMEQSNEALKEYSRALSLRPNGAGIYSNRALVHMSLHNYDEAIQDLSKAIEYEPCNPRNYFNRGYVIMSCMSHSSQADSGAATQPKPADPMGTVCKLVEVASADSLSEHERLMRMAVKDFSRVCDLEPDNTHSLVNRGTLNSLLRNYDDAVRDFSAALALNPTVLIANLIYFNRANAYQSSNQYEKAIQDYNEVVKSAPKEEHSTVKMPLVLYNKAQCHLQLNELDKALDAVDSALSLDSSLTKAEELRKQIQAKQSQSQSQSQ